MAQREVLANGMLKTINQNFDELFLNAGIPGVYTVVAGDDTANEIVIDTGLEEATGFDVTIRRAGVNVTADAAITLVDGVLTIADGAATYDATAGDKVYWRVF